MARSVILGNGRLTVGLNEKGLVHDFYYPYVGLENLTTARSIHHRIGVWVNGEFSWTDADEWSIQADFSSEALISVIVMTNKRLGIRLATQDFVDYEYDAFCRMISVKNISGAHQEVRLFMHQVFEISRGGRADTALYEPDGHYILDYKGRCCLLISGSQNTRHSFDQYAVGNYGIEGKLGTYKDAEDGELSGHPIEHGGVDSAIRFSLSLAADEEESINYWIIAGDSQFACDKIHAKFQDGIDKRLTAQQMYWKQWLSIGEERISKAPKQQQAMIRKSLMTIKAHTDARGGIIASCDSSIYNFGRDYYSYVWPRDGAYAMWPLIRLGYHEEPRAFFKFCADIISTEGYLMHKYQPDRAIGSTWHPLMHGNRRELAIQEDETATVVIMLGEYLDYSKDETFVREMFERFVVKAANFMSGFIDEATGLPHATYDLWEEKFATTTYTTATVYRALVVACELAEQFGIESQKNMWQATASSLLDREDIFINPDNNTYRKGYLLQEDGSLAFDNTIDISSMYGVMTFGYFKKDELSSFREATEVAINTLMDNTPAGGSPRYENDNYFKVSDSYLGNPWVITTLWVAQYYMRINEYDKASEIITWVQSKAMPSGVLPEQVHPDDGSPLSVTPLVWSHAEYINTVLDLTHRKPK
jgi:GH15 family glucan-1,4-alpha-glucosidase